MSRLLRETPDPLNPGSEMKVDTIGIVTVHDGPSLPAGEARALAPCRVLPPARAGDLFAVLGAVSWALLALVLLAMVLIPFIVPTVLSALAFWWIFDSQFSIISWSLKHLGLHCATVPVEKAIRLVELQHKAGGGQAGGASLPQHGVQRGGDVGEVHQRNSSEGVSEGTGCGSSAA